MARKTFEIQVMRTDPKAITGQSFAATFKQVFDTYGADFFLRLEYANGVLIDQWLMYDSESPASPDQVMETSSVKYSTEPIFAKFYVLENIQDWIGDTYPVRLVATSTIPAQYKEQGLLQKWGPRFLIGLGVAGAVAGGVALAKKAKVL